MKHKTIILADGRFPYGEVPLTYLNEASKIICCDGSVDHLLNYGLEPTVIVGDMDSVQPETLEKYASIIIPSDDQETNDLTKAVEYCVQKGEQDVIILGATGLREDHAIGNISLLADYSERMGIKMVTNHGTFTAITKTTLFKSFARQQVSIFSLTPVVQVTSQNLVYPLNDVILDNWWKGTLNESTADHFVLSLEQGTRLLVFQTHVAKQVR